MHKKPSPQPDDQAQPDVQAQPDDQAQPDVQSQPDVWQAWSYAAGELDECRELAGQIGIRHEVLQTDELANPDYQKNTADRCYYCKTELFVQVERLSRRLNVDVVVDGSNRDDHGEHRPGLRAAKEQQVASPLAECGFTKAEIRELANYWELPIWNKPATPCLSSRIAKLWRSAWGLQVRISARRHQLARRN